MNRARDKVLEILETYEEPKPRQSPMPGQIGGLRRENERLRGILRRHGIDPETGESEGPGADEPGAPS